VPPENCGDAFIRSNRGPLGAHEKVDMRRTIHPGEPQRPAQIAPTTSARTASSAA
jgi:hypothetical protein